MADPYDGEAKHHAGPLMTHGNMRELGVHRLVASCLNDACRHVALIDVSGYPADTEVPSFRSRVVCAKYGSRGNHIDGIEVPPSHDEWLDSLDGIPRHPPIF
jgi:hypothetical protein